MKKLMAVAAAAAAALTLAACEEVDPTPVIEAWLSEDCPSTEDIKAATGLDLPLQAGGNVSIEEGAIQCGWGEGDPDTVMIVALAMRGDPDGTYASITMPSRQEVEQAGGVYTEVPDLGPEAFTAGRTDGPASWCNFFTTTGDGADRLTLTVAVLGATGSDMDDLCSAAVATASIHSE